ncbi:MAG: beta-lactamase family protein [Gemmatimonadetes bacterium]|nr:beta-lactamase family protein [Gemmatimonadota bacterium]
MEKRGLTTYRKVSEWRPLAQITFVAMFAAAGCATGTALSSPADARILPMAAPEDLGMSSERFERLDAAMQRYIDADMVAGVVTLVARKGEVVHLKAQGHRYIEGGDRMSTDDIFVIMSMTKPIVSTALMMLFEEGYFLLDDPISKYMPEFADKEVVLEVDGGIQRVQADRPITFRHVLTHTAGVDPARNLLSEKERETPRGGATLEERLVAQGSFPLAFHPGDEWRYGSSTNYVALLVERISGQSLDVFLRERIFEPLGMVDTHYNVPASKVDRVTAVYSPSGPGNTIELRSAPATREQPTRYFGGTAGLSSTAGDYFRFSQMILNGGVLNGVRLLSPTTVNLMISNHTGDLPIYIKGADAYGFGLGFTMLTDPDRARQAVTPGTFGWGGAYGTVFWIDPVEDMVSILMMQMAGYGHFTLRQDFPNLVMQAITESYHSGKQAIRGYEPIPR